MLGKRSGLRENDLGLGNCRIRNKKHKNLPALGEFLKQREVNIGYLQLLGLCHCWCHPPVTAATGPATMGPKKATDVNGDELGTKRERDSYDAVFKLELIDMCTSGKYSSNAQALAAFNKLKQTSVTAGTMSKWLSSESKLRMQAADPSLKNKKHAKQSELPYVEESMRWWWYQVRCELHCCTAVDPSCWVLTCPLSADT
jgi:hypothetical protein